MVYFFNLVTFIFSVFKCFLVNNFLCVPITKYCLKASFDILMVASSGQPSLISVWKSMIVSLFWIGPRTSKEEKNLERNKLIENLIFIILLSWIIVLRKKISSEHCIRRIICTQMVILICKMSVILSEIPVSVSPYYNPNVSFISLSSFQNYDPQLEKNSPEV